MRHSLRFALPLVMTLAACAIARQDTNDPIDAEVVRSLVPGTTTAREVTERLGAPTRVVQIGRRAAYLDHASSAKSAVVSVSENALVASST